MEEDAETVEDVRGGTPRGGRCGMGGVSISATEGGRGNKKMSFDD